jgi:plasmid stability protein
MDRLDLFAIGTSRTISCYHQSPNVPPKTRNLEIAQIIVRNLESDLKTALKQRASQHGCSMEEEIRQILRRAVNEATTAPYGLGSRIAARFADLGLDAPLPEMHGQTVAPMTVDP